MVQNLSILKDKQVFLHDYFAKPLPHLWFSNLESLYDISVHADCMPIWKGRTEKLATRKTSLFGHLQDL